jgi:hypothetical protein
LSSNFCNKTSVHAKSKALCLVLVSRSRLKIQKIGAVVRAFLSFLKALLLSVV